MTDTHQTVSGSIVIKREGECHGARWMQIAIIRDGRVTWIEFRPALLAGWRWVRVEHSKPDSWPGMSAGQILSWMDSNHPECRVPVTVETARDAVERFGASVASGVAA